MDVVILLIVYRWWIHLPSKKLSIYLSKVAKDVRDSTDKPKDREMCVMFIKCVSRGEYELALKSLREGEIWHKVMG